MTRRHEDALAREQCDNDAVMTATSARHKDTINNVRAFKILKKQETIDKLRHEVREKNSEVTSLKAEVKSVLCGGAQEKEVMRNEH